MAFENQCYIIGNLAREPEMKYTNKGMAYCKFTVAANHKNKDKEITEWIPVVVFGGLAESCGSNLQKGSRVLVSGRFQTSKFKGKDGSDKYFTQIVAETVAIVLKSASTEWNKPGNGDFAQFGMPVQEPPKMVHPTLGEYEKNVNPEYMGPADEEIPF